MIINYLPEYRGGKSRINPVSQRFVDRMGPLVYNKMQQMGIYSDRAFDYLMRQLAFESANGTSKVAKKYNNYGGVRIPGKTTYQTYKNDKAFVDYWLPMMNRRYKNALAANSVDEYGMRLKKSGYYEAPAMQYIAGLRGSTSVAAAAANYAAQMAKANKQAQQAVDLITPQPVLKPVINMTPDYSKPSFTQPTASIDTDAYEEPAEAESQPMFSLPPIQDVYAAIMGDKAWLPGEVPMGNLMGGII